MITFRILPSIERLPESEPAIFGFNLAVEIDGAVELSDCPQAVQWFAQAFLRPWWWRSADAPKMPIQLRLTGMVFFWGSGGSFTASSPILIDEEPHLPVENLAKLHRELERRLAAFGKQRAPGRSPWMRPKAGESVDPLCRPWPAFLGEVSMLPWPLAQVLGLSLRAQPDTCSGTHIAAGPVFECFTDQGVVTLEPRYAEPEISGEPVTLVYGLDDLGTKLGSAELSNARLEVQTSPWQLAGWGKKGLANSSSHWVARRPGGFTGTDWRAGILERVASELEPTQIVVENLASKANVDISQIDGEVRKKLEDEIFYNTQAAVHALQALTLPRGRGAAPGSDFLRKAFRWVERHEGMRKALGEDRGLALESYARSWFRRLSGASWAGILARELRGSGEGETAELDVLKAFLDPETSRDKILHIPLVRLVAELAQIRAQVSRPQVARRLFDAFWRDLVQGAPESTGRLLEKVQNALPREINLHRWLVLDAGIERGNDVIVALAEGRGRYGELKAGEADRNLQRALGNCLSKVRWSSGGHLENQEKLVTIEVSPNRVEIALSRILYPERLTLGSDQTSNPQPLAQGISLEVGTIEAAPARDGVGSDDLLEKIQGMAVLLETAGTGWRCLNYGKAYLTSEKDTVLSPRVLLPSRLCYVDGFRYPVLTYDNEPMTAMGPLRDKSMAGGDLTDMEAVGSSLDSPLVSFRYSPEAQIPGLVFGRKYRAASFMITNSGAIPPSIERAIRDCSPVPEEQIPLDSGAVELHYLREAPVGMLRDDLPPLKEGTEWSKAPDPLAPRGFEARVTELPLERLLDRDDPSRLRLEAMSKANLQESRPALAIDPRLPAAEERVPIDHRLPVMLLVPPGLQPVEGRRETEPRKVHLWVPTVGLDVCDRWISRDRSEAGLSRRGLVQRAFRQLTHERKLLPCQSEPLEAAGIYLDDPAVEGFWISLKSFHEDGDGTVRELRSRYFPRRPKVRPPSSDTWRSPGWRPSLESEQSWPLALAIAAEAPECLSVECNDEALFEVRNGEGIYRLTVHAVLASGAEALFGFPESAGASRLRAAEGCREVFIDELQGSRWLTSPWHLLVEVAQPMPTGLQVADALWNALSFDQAKAKRGILDVTLDLSHATLRELRRHATQASLHQQSWIWQGRPPADLPSQDALGGERGVDAGRSLDFEMAEFGDRVENDAKPLAMTRKGLWPATEFQFSEDLNAIAPSGDGRALLERFAVRVFSRYAAVLGPDAGYLDGVKRDTASRWNRIWVPARKLTAIPPPAVRCVLPLTATEAGLMNPAIAQRGPGWLVVCDEPWYEVGGLQESLRVETVSVVSPDCPVDAALCEEFYQIGTDPLHHRGGVLDELGVPPDGSWRALDSCRYWVEFDGVSGAVGHRRGLDPSAGRFHAASFLVMPPRLLEVPGRELNAELAWWFFKLRFRRAVEIDGRSHLSEPSPAFWVQLLPGLERLEKDWHVAEGVRMDRSGLFTAPALANVQSHPTHLSTEFLVGLISQRVSDALGRRDQEAFLGLVFWNGRYWASDDETRQRFKGAVSAQGATQPALSLRWLEVQSREPITPQTAIGLWSRFFDPALPDSSRARIVRVSGSIPVVLQ